MSHTVRSAAMLAELSKYGVANIRLDEVLLDFPVTQEQIAQATALTPAHVNRTLQSLRLQGLLDGRTRVLRFPRWKALTELAEFDPTYLQTEIRPEQRVRIAHAN